MFIVQKWGNLSHGNLKKSDFMWQKQDIFWKISLTHKNLQDFSDLEDLFESFALDHTRFLQPSS